MNCELCSTDGGALLWRNADCRVVSIEEAGYPGFCRVIWNAHVKEMTDLTAPERDRFMRVVFETEAALRELLGPDKVNLASLGNVTPHLHWHVIPRFLDDPHFPNPVWSAAVRPAAPSGRAVADLPKAIAARLSRLRTDPRPIGKM